MSSHVYDLLAEHALGTLQGSDAERATAHLITCARCRAELSEVEAGLALLALELDPVSPSEQVRGRVLKSISEGGRFAGFAADIAALLDVTRDAAAAILDKIDASVDWIMGPAPGVETLRLTLGPAYAGHFASLVRIRPGSTFPFHNHLGEETAIVLQGACRDPDGTVRCRGDVIEYAAGTGHDFVAEAGPAFVAVVRVKDGVSFTPAR